MAIFDAMFELFDDAILIATSTFDYVGTTVKTIDFINYDLEMGAGTPIWINIRVGTTAYVGGTNARFVLFADTLSVSHDANSDQVLSTGWRPITELTAGAWILRCPLPVKIDDARYLSLGIETDGATTAGTIDAWLDHGPQSSHGTQVSTSNI